MFNFIKKLFGFGQPAPVQEEVVAVPYKVEAPVEAPVKLEPEQGPVVEKAAPAKKPRKPKAAAAKKPAEAGSSSRRGRKPKAQQ